MESKLKDVLYSYELTAESFLKEITQMGIVFEVNFRSVERDLINNVENEVIFINICGKEESFLISLDTSSGEIVIEADKRTNELTALTSLLREKFPQRMKTPPEQGSRDPASRISLAFHIVLLGFALFGAVNIMKLLWS